ncbi:MAG: hypothetical protein RIS44_3123 [Pseudomonadota bacterium]|jgi:hypothetical protein
MHLRAIVSASPCDEDRDDLSFVYAYDEDQKYCVSLGRFPDSEVIELMVSDQLTVKVAQLAVTLTARSLIVELPPAVAAALDGNVRYEIEFVNAAEVAAQLPAALQAVFKGKQGLEVVAA